MTASVVLWVERFTVKKVNADCVRASEIRHPQQSSSLECSKPQSSKKKKSFQSVYSLHKRKGMECY